MKILIATGGSGGHIFPALKVAQHLKGQGHEIIFAGTFGAWESQIKGNRFEVRKVEARGFSFARPGSVVTMGRAVGTSFSLLRQTKPDIVLGFGGYAAFPVVLAAAIGRYPTLIHEQNVVPGRANYILSKFVSRVAVSFSLSRKYFKEEKTIVTGCPCHFNGDTAARQAILKKFQLKDNLKTILVLGGSQGSQRINEEFLKAVDLLKKEMRFQVIHVTGHKDYTRVKEAYRQYRIPVWVCPFLEDIHEAYEISDVAVARAGAVTVAELGLFAVPSVLIPYPHAGGHQRENAAVLSAHDLATVIEQKDLNAGRLKEAIVARTSTTAWQAKRADNLREDFFPDAKERLAQAVLKLKQ